MAADSGFAGNKLNLGEYLFETNSVPMLLVENDKIVNVNSCLCELLEVPRGEIVSLYAHEVFMPAGSGQREDFWNRRAGENAGMVKCECRKEPCRDLEVGVLPVLLDGSGTVLLEVKGLKAMTLAEKKLEIAERKYKSIFENSVEGIFQTTVTGRYITINPALVRIYGYESEQEMIKALTDIRTQLYVEPGRRDDFKRLMETDHVVANFESRVFRKDGSVIWISENARAVYAPGGGISYYEGTVVDITERKMVEAQLEEQRIYYRQLFENSPLAMVLVNADGIIMDINSSFAELFGYAKENVLGQSNRAMIVPPALLPEVDILRRSILKGKCIQKDTERMHRTGRLIPVSLVGYPVTVSGEVQAIFFCYMDTSQKKAYEEQLAHQAFHDPLTGLANRSLFRERLDRAIKRGDRDTNFKFSVLLLDLDKFKQINDSLGHLAGDDFLVAISGRLSSCLRSVDTISRLGGDEFGIILEDYARPKDVIGVIRRIQAVMKEPLNLDGQVTFASASIGVVLSTDRYTSPEDVLRDADIAMYRSKESGEGGFRVFNQEMYRQAVDSLCLETDLRSAIKNNEFYLNYQPIYSVAGGKLIGFEALVRWQHPEKGVVPPDKFIPLSEETGLIIPLGEWVVREACRQLVEWTKNNPAAGELSVSVNVSGRQLAQMELPDIVKRVLDETGLEPNRLKLEITETAAMRNVDLSIDVLTRLRHIGVQLMIDDFGTGYSSLTYLQQFPLDYLKIDRGFISGDGYVDSEIVRTIVSLARSLGLKVVAEGVENMEQFELLEETCCDQVQGYMFSRPLVASEAEKLFSGIKEE